MRDRTELDIERSEIDAAARRDYGDRNFRRIALGSAFGLEQGSAEFGRINRALQPWPEVDDGAEMVFMGVGEDEGDHARHPVPRKRAQEPDRPPPHPPP